MEQILNVIVHLGDGVLNYMWWKLWFDQVPVLMLIPLLYGAWHVFKWIGRSLDND